MLRKILKERLSEAMQAAQMNTAALAKAAKVPERSIEKTLEDGIVPERAQEERIAEALQVSIPYLMDWDSMYPFQEEEETAAAYQIVGNIRTDDTGRIVEEFTDEYIAIPVSWLLGRSPSEYFIMRAGDSSMRPEISRGDLLFVRKAPACDNGTTAIVLLDGSRAAARRIHYDDTGTLIRLEAVNPEYPDNNITGEALESCHVLGHAERLIRMLV